MVIAKLTQKELIEASYGYKALPSAVHSEYREAVVMPIDDKFSPETGHYPDYDTNEQQWNARGILNQNYIVPSA